MFSSGNYESTRAYKYTGPGHAVSEDLKFDLENEQGRLNERLVKYYGNALPENLREVPTPSSKVPEAPTPASASKYIDLSPKKVATTGANLYGTAYSQDISNNAIAKVVSFIFSGNSYAAKGISIALQTSITPFLSQFVAPALGGAAGLGISGTIAIAQYLSAYLKTKKVEDLDPKELPGEIQKLLKEKLESQNGKSEIKRILEMNNEIDIYTKIKGLEKREEVAEFLDSLVIHREDGAIVFIDGKVMDQKELKKYKDVMKALTTSNEFDETALIHKQLHRIITSISKHMARATTEKVKQTQVPDRFLKCSDGVFCTFNGDLNVDAEQAEQLLSVRMEKKLAQEEEEKAIQQQIEAGFFEIAREELTSKKDMDGFEMLELIDIEVGDFYLLDEASEEDKANAVEIRKQYEIRQAEEEVKSKIQIGFNSTFKAERDFLKTLNEDYAREHEDTNAAEIFRENLEVRRIKERTERIKKKTEDLQNKKTEEEPKLDEFEAEHVKFNEEIGKKEALKTLAKSRTAVRIRKSRPLEQQPFDVENQDRPIDPEDLPVVTKEMESSQILNDYSTEKEEDKDKEKRSSAND